MALVKSSEGLRLKAYRLPGEKYLTIGWGHYGPDVTAGMVITRERADELLRRDLWASVAAVNGAVRVPLTQGQFDALVSFTFNVGAGAFASSTLLKRVNEQQWKRATAEFGRWVFGVGHTKLPGLVVRRAQEARLFWLSRPKKKVQPTLYAVLLAKAKLGRFDARMCGYYGPPANVNAACKRFICRMFVAGLVPTFTTNGKHSPTSYHPRGMAVDAGLRRELVGTTRGRKRLVEFQRREHAAFHAGRRPRMLELIGPENTLVVLRGRETDLVEGSALEQQHDGRNAHVHGAFTNA